MHALPQGCSIVHKLNITEYKRTFYGVYLSEIKFLFHPQISVNLLNENAPFPQKSHNCVLAKTRHEPSPGPLAIMDHF